TVIELWTLSAEELLATPDVSLAVWALLAKFDGPPEVLLQRCRTRIDRDGGEQRENLLAVAQVYAKLHFDKPEWLSILGGSTMFINSPLVQEVVAKTELATRKQTIREFLEARFGSLSANIPAALEQVKEGERLTRLIRQAATCKDLEAFEKQLRQELPA